MAAQIHNRAVARASDPATSWAAASSLEPDAIGRGQRFVWTLLQDHGPMTDEDLVILAASILSPSGARTRRCELVARGLVRDTGDRVRLRSGRMAIVWEARWLELTLWGPGL